MAIAVEAFGVMPMIGASGRSKAMRRPSSRNWCRPPTHDGQDAHRAAYGGADRVGYVRAMRRLQCVQGLTVMWVGFGLCNDVAHHADSFSRVLSGGGFADSMTASAPS